MSVINFGGITLGELVDQITETYPDTEALVYPDRGLRYTYTEFREACNQDCQGVNETGGKKR